MNIHTRFTAKLLALIRIAALLLLLMVALTACSADKATPTSNPEPQNPTPTSAPVPATSKPASPTTAAQAPLPLPASVELTAQPGDTSVDLKWQPIAGARGYFIFRDNSSIPLNPTPMTDTHFQDIGLTNARTYTYTVAPLNQDGQTGPRSHPVQATPK